MERKIKTGFSVIQKPFEEYIDYAVSHKLTHLEIDLLQSHSFIETFDDKRLSNARGLCEGNAITLSLHTPYIMNLIDTQAKQKKDNIVYLKKTILIASKLKAAHITSHTGYCKDAFVRGKMREQALEWLVVILKDILKDCEKFKVNIAVENVDLLPPENKAICLGDNIGDFEFLFSQIESPYLNLCLDTGHANTNEGPLTYIEKFAGKIVCVHCHDNNGRHDDHLDIGEGSIPWRKVISALKKTGFIGPYISETFDKLEPHQNIDRLLGYFTA